MASFELDIDEFESLQQSMEAYGDGAIRIINDVIQNEGAEKIKAEIMPLLPASGRTWKRKKAPARSAAPFTQQSEMLAVTVKTVSSYNYLYFPDDGSNTIKHMGNQQFMQRGAENASSAIIDLCVGQLTEEL